MISGEKSGGVPNIVKIFLFFMLCAIILNFSTHNHLLLKGDIKNDVNYHLKSKSLIGDHVKHEPYKEGASMYVSKYICDEKTYWGIIENNY